MADPEPTGHGRRHSSPGAPAILVGPRRPAPRASRGLRPQSAHFVRNGLAALAARSPAARNPPALRDRQTADILRSPLAPLANRTLRGQSLTEHEQAVSAPYERSEPIARQSPSGLRRRRGLRVPNGSSALRAERADCPRSGRVAGRQPRGLHAEGGRVAHRKVRGLRRHSRRDLLGPQARAPPMQDETAATEATTVRLPQRSPRLSRRCGTTLCCARYSGTNGSTTA